MAMINCAECSAQISSKAKTCPQCGAAPEQKTKRSTWLIVGFLAVVVISFAGKESPSQPVANSAPLAPNTQPEQPAAEDPKAVALDKIDLRQNWRMDGSQQIFVDFIITNNSQYAVKDIEIRCWHYAESGSKVGTNVTTIYRVFNKHSQLEIPRYLMGYAHSQTHKVGCNVTDLKAS